MFKIPLSTGPVILGGGPLLEIFGIAPALGGEDRPFIPMGLRHGWWLILRRFAGRRARQMDGCLPPGGGFGFLVYIYIPLFIKVLLHAGCAMGEASPS